MKSGSAGLPLCLAYMIIGTVTGLKLDFLYYLELEESGKQEFVDAHNHFRRLVSNPEAANMRLMTWEEDLAELARNHVRKCKFPHSLPSELKTDRFPTAGENVYAGNEFYYSEMMTTKGVTKKWYDEIQYYDYTTLSCKQGEICGHYTQLVWAQSYKVGCYMAKCSKIEGGNGEHVVTCAYGPGGNQYYNGKALKPYISGEACSACGSGDLCIDQLCNNTERDIPFTTTTTRPATTTTHSTTTSPISATTSTATSPTSTAIFPDVKTASPTTTFLTNTTTVKDATTTNPAKTNEANGGKREKSTDNSGTVHAVLWPTATVTAVGAFLGLYAHVKRKRRLALKRLQQEEISGSRLNDGVTRSSALEVAAYESVKPLQEEPHYETI